MKKILLDYFNSIKSNNSLPPKDIEATEATSKVLISTQKLVWVNKKQQSQLKVVWVNLEQQNQQC